MEISEVCYDYILTPIIHKNTISTKSFTISCSSNQDQYIVQIQCTKGTFFICIDSSPGIKPLFGIKEEPVYFFMGNSELESTYGNIDSIKFFHNLKQATENPKYLSCDYSLDMIFCCVSDKDLDVEILNKKSNIVSKPDIDRKGKLSVFSLEGIGNSGDFENFLITLTCKGSEKKYLELKVI